LFFWFFSPEYLLLMNGNYLMAKLRKTFGDLWGWAFIGPGLLVTLLLISYPVIYILYLSFVDGIKSQKFVFFKNYLKIINLNNFGEILGNTAIWTVTTVLFAFLIGLIAALLIEQPFVKGKSFWRSILMLAWITPGVAKATIWKWMYSQDFGIINYLLTSLNIVHQPVAWLSSTEMSLPSVMLVQIWSAFPFAMLMIAAGLQAIPEELYEAAKLDGARSSQTLRYVVMPMLRNVTFITILILSIWSLNEFAVIWIVTQGGPAGSSQVLALKVYDLFRAFNIGPAAATAVMQLGVSLIFAFIYLRTTLKNQE